MPRTVKLSTYLDAHPDVVWDHVQTPKLLHFVARGLIRFVPKGAAWPERWTPARHHTWMLLFGVIPIGWQVIGIEFPQADASCHIVRDNGYGPLIKRWDHWIEIQPEGDGTRYTDRVHIDAGLMTAPVTAFARVFYAHRQRRWRRLVARDFRYD